MSAFVIVIHVLTCLFMILLVLVQSGKGAEISASFGGSSQTVFGSGGGANFFTRMTAGCAVVFMVTSILLTLQSSESSKSVFEGTESAEPLKEGDLNFDPAPTAPPADAPKAKEAAGGKKKSE